MICVLCVKEAKRDADPARVVVCACVWCVLVSVIVW